MNIITQLNLFEEYELGELDKINQICNLLPDEKLIQAMNKDRKNGRNDFPNHAMWRAFIALFVFQHRTVNSLCRELQRNSQLRQVCGFTTHYIKQKGNIKKVLAPDDYVFSRFLQRLIKYQDLVEELFNHLVTYLYDNINDFGKYLAIDGKIIESYANTLSQSSVRDGRRELDARHTCKVYTDKNGKNKITIHFFGFRVHVICDTSYELPIAFDVLPANVSEQKVAEQLINQLPTPVIQQAQYLMADKGYDSTRLIERLEDKNITPIIPNRQMWKDKETRQYLDTDLVYDQSGKVYYVDEKGQPHCLVPKGYDKQTDSLRYGFRVQENDKRIFRIKRCEDKRIFSKVDRQSKKFKRLMKKRTAVERINGRIDRDFMFEYRDIRGLNKMKTLVSLAFIIQLGFACLKLNHQTHLASWVA